MRATTIALALLIAAASSPAMDYFPFHQDAEYLYMNQGSGVGEASFDGASRYFHAYDMGNFVHNDHYSVWNGHLLLESWQVGPSWEVRTYDLDPPACLLRQPLAVGDYWHIRSRVGAWPYDYDLHVLAQVVEEVEVAAPYGTLPTLHITYEMVSGNYGEFFSWRDVWLHETLGIVKMGEWELSGIEWVVPTETSTLTSVRALFR